MRLFKLSLLFVLIGAALVGCGKKEAAAEATGEATAAVKPAAPAKLTFIPIPKMNLQIEMPEGSTVVDMSADAPNAKITHAACEVSVSTVTIAYEDNVEASAKSSLRPLNGGKVTKQETTPDGWHLEFEGKNLLGEMSYGFKIRSKVGDKQYECSRNGKKEELACALKACKSLKAS